MNDLGGPPVLPPRVVRHLVVTHLLRRVVVGDDARGRRQVLLAHHAAKAFLVKADPIDGPLPCDGHVILGEGKVVGAFGDPAGDVDLHLGVVPPLVVVIRNDGRVARVEGEEGDFWGRAGRGGSGGGGLLCGGTGGGGGLLCGCGGMGGAADMSSGASSWLSSGASSGGALSGASSGGASSGASSGGASSGASSEASSGARERRRGGG